MDEEFGPAALAIYGGEVDELRALLMADAGLAMRVSSVGLPTLLQLVACQEPIRWVRLRFWLMPVLQRIRPWSRRQDVTAVRCWSSCSIVAFTSMARTGHGLRWMRLCTGLIPADS